MAMLFVALCAFFNQRNVWSQLAYASSVEILGGQRSALSPWVLIISFLLGFPAACAVALNWGWDTNAIFGHVDPHPRVESACAGSYG